MRDPIRLVARLATVLVVLAAVPAVAAAQGEEGLLITLQADNTPVVNVLEILAERSGLNIVTSPEVQAIPISIRLANTPFEEALNLVVRAAGMGYERVGNSILVGSPQRLATQTGLTTKVYDLQYADALETREALEVMSDQIRSFGAGNQLIVKAPQSVLEEMDALVAVLDRRPEQVMFQARLVEVNTSNLRELGIDWEKITNFTTIITEGDPGSSQVDKLPTTIGYTPLDEYQTYHRQLQAFEVQLNALITDGNARLLANSKVVTMENQAAEVFIGQTIPVVITSLQSAPGAGGGAFQTVQLEYVDVGVKLSIKPRVAADGAITVQVNPEVSSIVRFVGPDEDLPQTSTRRATATVRVSDGQTFYLGGLLNEEEKKTIKKVPLLGDIPLLGYLFRSYRLEKTQTDILIEITPTLVRDRG